jgi:Fe-S-cluster-containing dehydrogenase component
MRRVMVIDTQRCVGCEACVIACKTENRVPAGAYRDWVVQETTGELPNLALLIQSQRCNHCTNAPCVANCPTGASFYRGDGTVQVDRDLCTGCRACMASCPYDARYVHPEGFVDKCTLCAHRLDVGKPTACQEVCPTSAIVTGDLDDPSSEVARMLRQSDVTVVHAEAGTKPNVYYLNGAQR